MLKAIRYTLAAMCLAASLGCLALWWRSTLYLDNALVITRSVVVQLTSFQGSCRIFINANRPNSAAAFQLKVNSLEVDYPLSPGIRSTPKDTRQFRANAGSAKFPLWYAALVFALAAVAAIRIGRQFTLRSALAGMSVVAILLGMVVAM
jgi:hypothetical protein